MGQSLAIVRYIARLAKLSGDTDREFAASEQLIQEGVPDSLSFFSFFLALFLLTFPLSLVPEFIVVVKSQS
jgi:hypothetical protein